MDGDGFPDFVVSRCGGTWSVYRGSKEGFSRIAISWAAPNGACHIRAVYTEDQWGCTQHAPGSTTKFDTLDMDGDGIPDYVDANTTPWTVYRGGRDPATGQWGFLQDAQHALVWPAPFNGLQRTARMNYTGFDGDAGTATLSQLRDMNGDGLPDLIEAFPADCDAQDPITWRIWLNNRHGFSDPDSRGIPMETIANRSAFTKDDGTTTDGTFDVNGDGLPDYVWALSSTEWYVCLNDGHGRLDLNCEVWNLPQSYGQSGPTAIAKVLKNNEWGYEQTVRDFFDINGDGLPDVVDADPANHRWLVVLNRGDGFSDTAILWTGIPQDWGGFIRYSTSRAAGNN